MSNKKKRTNQSLLVEKEGVWVQIKLSPDANRKLEQLVASEKIKNEAPVHKDVVMSSFAEQELLKLTF